VKVYDFLAINHREPMPLFMLSPQFRARNAHARARYSRANERKGLRARVRICVIAAVFKSGRSRVSPVASTTFPFLTGIFMSSRLIAPRCQLYGTYFRASAIFRFSNSRRFSPHELRSAAIGRDGVIAFYVAPITGVAQFLRSFRKVKRARVSAFYLLRGRASTFTAR